MYCTHCFTWNNLYLTMYCIRVILNLKGRDFMPLSEARKRANAKYTAKAYDDMKLRVKKGERDRLKAYADSQGMSLNNFVCSCLSYCISQCIDVSSTPALTETLPEDTDQ